MTAPDPRYILLLSVFLLFGDGVLASRRNHDLRKCSSRWCWAFR